MAVPDEVHAIRPKHRLAKCFLEGWLATAAATGKAESAVAIQVSIVRIEASF